MIQKYTEYKVHVAMRCSYNDSITYIDRFLLVIAKDHAWVASVKVVSLLLQLSLIHREIQVHDN